MNPLNLPPPDLPPPAPAPPPAPDVSPDRPPPSSLDTANPYATPLTDPTPPPRQRPDVPAASRSLGGIIRESFAYPLQPFGTGAIFIGFTVIILIVAGPLAPFVGAVVALGGWAYGTAYYFEVICSTLNGDSEQPPWPDISNVWDDIAVPSIQMVVVWCISSAVQLATLLLNMSDEGALTADVLYGLGAFVRWLYFPMATIALVTHGTLWAALPHRVLPALVRCLPSYLACAGAFAAAELLNQALSAALSDVPLVGWFLPFVVFFYVLLVQARLTGLIFLKFQNRINW